MAAIRRSPSRGRRHGQHAYAVEMATWANEDALKAHMVTPEIKAAVPKLEPVLAKSFSQIFLSMVSDS
jgi:quinol monooxygenase YgiN